MNTTFYHHPLHQGLALVTPPASEPVTVAEAKLWLRQDIDDDDALIGSLITAARSYAEVVQKRQLMSATYKLALDQFPVWQRSWGNVGPSIVLPLPKLQSVTSVKYVDMSGTQQTLSTGRYVVDVISQPGRITPVYWQTWPTIRPQTGAVEVVYVAGYADAASVPEATKTAIKMLVAHWYRNREAVGTVGGKLEFSVASLLAIDAVGSYS